MDIEDAKAVGRELYELARPRAGAKPSIRSLHKVFMEEWKPMKTKGR